MARVESKALAGYYKTPVNQIPRIAGLLEPDEFEESEEANRSIAILDPCAGDGELLELLARALRKPLAVEDEVEAKKLGREFEGFEFFACEMEKTRAQTLRDRRLSRDYNQRNVLCGNVFRVQFAGDGVGILFLNPPYDHDKDFGRLEERFLSRFTAALAPGGVLVFLVPHYALSASAGTLGRSYEELACYKFADGEYDTFKQVVLFAKRRDADLRDPDPVILWRCAEWAAKPENLPEMPPPGSKRPRYSVPKTQKYRDALSTWKMQVVDVEALVPRFKPWHETTRARGLVPLSRILPDLPIADLMHRVYEVATPPRPAHIAAGIAAGLFNGQRILPDDETLGLPPLLVKGVFDREWRTVEEKQNKDGDTISVVQVQQPKLVVTILDLVTHRFHTLGETAIPAVMEEPVEFVDVEFAFVSESAVLAVKRHEAKLTREIADRQAKNERDDKKDEALLDADKIDYSTYRSKTHERSTALEELIHQHDKCDGLIDLAVRFDKARKLAEERAVAQASGLPHVSAMSVGDLLKYYGKSLVGVMERQCAILYDRRHDANIELAEIARKPFVAQEHAARACVKLLRERPGRTPWLCGEIGVGKSVTALIVAKTQGAKRVLVMAPPHLVTKSWPDEIAFALPEYEYRLLESISDVEALAALSSDRPVVAVLSRETAKLGHGIEGLQGGTACPKCGLEVPCVVDHAKRRSRCGARGLIAADDYAKAARQLALYLRASMPSAPEINDVLRGRWDRKRSSSVQSETRVPDDFILKVRSKIAWDWITGVDNDDLKRALVWCFTAFPDDSVLLKLLAVVYDRYDWTHFAEELPLLLSGSALATAREIVKTWPADTGYSSGKPIDRLDAELASEHAVIAGYHLSRVSGVVSLDGVEIGSPQAAVRLLRALEKLGKWSWSSECREPLYQAIPEPRRYPLAKYILRRHPDLFDFLIFDENHEYSSEISAQGKAAGRLSTLGIPTVVMTGTVMNGYASSLFHPMVLHSPEFREEFDRGDMNAFVDRFGYRKRVLQDKDEEGKVVSFGSQTDRVERTERDAGDAPGILPLFLFRHLLPSAVTLHKSDLRIDLPACTQERVPIEVSDLVLREYQRILKLLVDQIKEDRFEPEIAGKLFGQLAELPSYLDRCTVDVGNGGGAGFEVAYPESVGGEIVAVGKLFPKSTILPKEAKMLARLRSELSEGRNVLVFGWHVGLLPRLSRLIEEQLGEKAPILYSDKVPTGKRQAWIEREIVGKKRRIMVSNPVCIQTGLNNLVWFNTEWWHENPACNPITDRQAIGRVDRIGQKKDTRIVRSYYDGTLQGQMYDLLMAKVAISTAVDGLDPEAALLAAGIGDSEYMTGLSIGKQLWAMMQDKLGEDRHVIAIDKARKKVSK